MSTISCDYCGASSANNRVFVSEDLEDTKRERYFRSRGRFPVCSRCRQRVLSGLPAGRASAEESLSKTLHDLCSKKHKIAKQNDPSALRKLANVVALHAVELDMLQTVLQKRLDELPLLTIKLRNQRILTCQRMVKKLNLASNSIREINAYISQHIVIDYADARRAATNATRPEWIRLNVTAKFNGKCRYCGSTEKLTIDHARPVFRGGDSEMDNLQLLCQTCNSRKGIADKAVQT